jgi:hypothetical protein
MRNYLIPAAGIVLVSVILLALNEWTGTIVNRDYAYFFIVAAMLLGVWLTRLSKKVNDET